MYLRAPSSRPGLRGCRTGGRTLPPSASFVRFKRSVFERFSESFRGPSVQKISGIPTVERWDERIAIIAPFVFTSLLTSIFACCGNITCPDMPQKFVQESPARHPCTSLKPLWGLLL